MSDKWDSFLSKHGMYTKGCYGFRFDNNDYIFLNQMESYIDGLGEHIFNFLKYMLYYEYIEPNEKESIFNLFIKNIKNIEYVNGGSIINNEERKYLEKFHEEFELSDKNHLLSNTWYDLFSLEEGNLDMYLDGFKYMVKNTHLLLMSGEIKYSYIINLDEKVFEVYYGDNDKPLDNRGRYANLKHPFLSGSYYGVELMKTISFDEILDKMKLNKDRDIKLLDFLI